MQACAGLNRHKCKPQSTRCSRLHLQGSDLLQLPTAAKKDVETTDAQRLSCD